MAYIGKQPSAGDFTVLDSLTASATATYTLQKNSVNFVPGSANQLIVSLNGVIQEPGTSFTLNGSSLVFSSALTSADSIDFILALGGVGNFNTPSDDSVTTAKIATDAVTSAKIADDAITAALIADDAVGSAAIADDAITSALIDDNAVVTAAINGNAVTAAKFNADVISGQTELASEPADTDEFLVSDAGVLKRIDYSLIKGGGGLVFLATSGTISSGTSAVDFNSSILTTTYGAYMFIFEAVFDSVSSGSEGIAALLSNDNGSTIPTSGYRTCNWRVNEGGHNDFRSQGTIAKLSLGKANGVYQGNAAGEGVYGKMFLYDPTTSSMQTRMEYQLVTIADRNTGHGDESLTYVTGASAQSEPLGTNFIRFLPDSGTFEGGVIRCYGIVDSA